MEYRIEHDSMGEVKVPADKYWAETDRTQPRELFDGWALKPCPAGDHTRFRYPEKGCRYGKPQVPSGAA